MIYALFLFYMDTLSLFSFIGLLRISYNIFAHTLFCPQLTPDLLPPSFLIQPTLCSPFLFLTFFKSIEFNF